MAELYPTKARLALLQAIDDGAVRHHIPFRYGHFYDEWGHRKVTARVNELYHAGWVRLADREPDVRWSRRWELTDAGRAVLEAHRDT